MQFLLILILKIQVFLKNIDFKGDRLNYQTSDRL